MAITRRTFLKWLAGSGVALGTSGAGFQHLMSSREDPDGQIPGISTWYATTCRECPAGCGMLVRNREGRAIKCEGNPEHPINRGRLCARGQAALQGLYDPDRVRGPLRRGANGRLEKCSWEEALAAVGRALAEALPGKVAIVSDLQHGSLADFFVGWLKLAGSELYSAYEPLGYDSLRRAYADTYNHPKIPYFRIAECDFLISFGVDFLEAWISPVRAAREFAQMRTPTNGRMGTFIYAGPRLSATAANADRVFMLKPGQEGWLAVSMLNVMAEEGLAHGDCGALAEATRDYTPERIAPALRIVPEEIRRLARAFARARAPLALGGHAADTSRAAHESAAAAAMLNAAVRTAALDFTRVHALSRLPGRRSLSRLCNHLVFGKGGPEVDLLFIYGANPAFASPSDLRFSEAANKVKTVVSLSSHMDETAALAHWVLPVDTPLESWGDYEPEPGVACLLQPTMGRLFDTRHVADVLLAISQAAGHDPTRAFGADTFQKYLKRRWISRLGGDAEASWENALQRGGAWTEASPAAAPKPGREYWHVSLRPPQESDAISLWTYPSPALHDGRGANKRWLQELPEPMVHGTWGSWVELHPDTAAKLGVRTGDQVRLSSVPRRSDARSRHYREMQMGLMAGMPTPQVVSVEAPALVWPGVAPGTAAIALGQGHTAFGRYARDRGVNAFTLLRRATDVRPSHTFSVERTGRKQRIAIPPGATLQQGRGLARDIALTGLTDARPGNISLPLPEGYTPEHDMYEGHKHKEHRWAMAVDLSRCTGCGACITACYAENNVAVVGEKMIRQGRIMSWLRIDRYFEWNSKTAPARFLPMLCQHCDSAPCESVCPVFATAHSQDGLNMMVYNRCIGTRYCSNNCPYKVRRFNWFHYDWPGALRLQLNPDLSVRDRGVMEKCTFCVQRIREATQRARVEGRRLRDGEIIPACAQTCPSDALLFGDLMDRGSRVSRVVRTDPRRYQVLHHLNTKPAVIYLKRIVNDVGV